MRFCTSRRHAPHFSQQGVKTEQKKVTLELKTIADVGLLGFPSVGKSTLLSKISGAKPMIAAYHFTTLSPNLGVVTHYDEQFVVADIPGLIEGAAEGAGLGHEFLRHVERTRMLVHIVDMSGSEGRNPVDDYKMINKELKRYNEELSKVPQIIVANKMDIEGADENLKEFKKRVKKPVYPISAINSAGIEAMLDAVWETLKTLPPLKPVEEEVYAYERKSEDDFSIKRDEDGAYVVIGPLVDLLIRNVVLNDMDSLAYMQKTLKEKGVFKALKEQGIIWLVGGFLGMADVAVFDLASKIVTLPRTLMIKMNDALFPKIAVRSSAREIQRIMWVGTILSLLAILTIAAIGKWLVLWLGHGELPAAYPVSIILSLTILFWMLGTSFINFVFVPTNNYYLVTLNQAVSLVTCIGAATIWLTFAPSVYGIAAALAFSGLCEVLFCSISTHKKRLLT